MVNVNEFTVVDYRRGIVDIFPRIHETYNDGNIDTGFDNFLQGIQVLRDELGFKKQVFGRVPAYRQFREGKQVDTRRP